MITLPEAMIEIQQRLDEIDGEGQIWPIGVMEHRSKDGEGVVLFFRSSEGDYGTLRWGIPYDDWRGRVRLYEGHYDIQTYDEAQLDFIARVDQ